MKERRSFGIVMLLLMSVFIQDTAFRTPGWPAFCYSCKPAKVTLPSCSTHPCPISNQHYSCGECISNAGTHCYAVFSLYMLVSDKE